MEIEMRRKRPIYYCAVLSVISWFAFLLYMTLTRIDEEYSQGLIENNGMQWKVGRKTNEKKLHKLDWLFLKSLGKQAVEINRASHHQRYDKAKNDIIMEAFLSPGRKGHLIRNWLSKDDDTYFQNEKGTNETIKKASSTDHTRYLVINKMREKIIHLYGNTLTLSVNDSSFIKLRNWKRPGSQKLNFELTALLPTSPSPITSRLGLHFQKALESPRNALRRNHRNNTKKVSLKKRKKVAANKTDTVNTLNQRFKENKRRLDRIWIEEIRKSNSSSIKKKLRNMDILFQDKHTGNQTLQNSSQVNISLFELSTDETSILTRLSREKNDFLDISETNVHNELGPINKYVDLVYIEDQKNNVNDYRSKQKSIDDEEPQFDRMDISITIRHNKKLGMPQEKSVPHKIYPETVPPEVEAKQRKESTKVEKHTAISNNVNKEITMEDGEVIQLQDDSTI